jgi:hydrogenase expression/formation protein HypC
MCLAIPGKIEKIKNNYALVDFGGVKKDIKIILTPEVNIGEYVLVHAGFSIQRINEKEAKEFLKIWGSIKE